MSIEIFSRKEKKMELTLRKGIIGSFLAGVLLMGAAVAAQPQVAYADDGRDSAPQTLVVTEIEPRSATDSVFHFTMSGNGTNGTSGRTKDNATSSYVGIDYISKACRMYIDGAHGKYGPWSNCTVGGYANATRVGNWRIMNYVNEWGYSHARLTAWANNGATTVYGVWSSDSVGTYPSINA